MATSISNKHWIKKLSGPHNWGWKSTNQNSWTAKIQSRLNTCDNRTL